MVNIFHSSSEIEPDLRSRRVAHPETGRLMKHSVCRHLLHEDLRWPNGELFNQGTLFPEHLTAGQITKIERMVLEEYQNYLHGKKSNVRLVQKANGADRVVILLKKFGVEEVGAFIRNGSICTVFPEDVE